jgi:hypothetical protein
MSERSPYSRVYWTIRNDPRLADIYPNDAHLAAWLRLLIAADMAWPAPADVPVSIRRGSLNALCGAGVIDLLPGGLFCFHGLDDERGRRRAAAQASVAHRTGIERVSTGDRSIPKRSTSRAETSIDEPSRDTNDPVVAYYETTTRVPKGGALDWLHRLEADYGGAVVATTVRATSTDPLSDFLSRVELALASASHKAHVRAAAVSEEAWRAAAPPPRTSGDPLLLSEIRAEIDRKKADA